MSNNPKQPSNSPIQRLIVPTGVLIVVVLTVIAAILLAQQGQPPIDEQPTATVLISPTVALSPTPDILPTPSPTRLPPLPSFTNTPTISTPPPPSLPSETPVIVVTVVTPTSEPSPTVGLLTGCETLPPEGWRAYIIQTEDTLSSLAERTGSTVFELQRTNCLSSPNPEIGKIIFLPRIPLPPTVTRTPSPAPPKESTPTRTPTPIVPIIESITPNNVDLQTASKELTITVIGRNFRFREAGFIVKLRGAESITLKLGDIGTDTNFEAIVPPGLPEGSYDLVIINSQTGRTGVKPNAYVIGPPPPTAVATPDSDIFSVSPTSGLNDIERIITVEGKNFLPADSNFLVQLRLGNITENLTLVAGSGTSSHFSAIVPASLTAGFYDLWVINPDSQPAVKGSAYEVVSN